MRDRRCRIWSALPRGSGALVVHNQLERAIPGYVSTSFDPRREYFPPLLASLRNQMAGIVHAAPDHGALLASPGQPLVVTFHNFVLDDEGMAFSSLHQRIHYRTDLAWLTRAAIRRAAVVTAVSEFTAQKVSQFYELREPVRVIGNGVDTEFFTPAQREKQHCDGKFRVLVSGNASRRKGTHLLGRIARHLSPGIELVCTLEQREARRWIGELENVRAVGKQPLSRMPDLYRECDALLMPTAREGFGLAVAEAMATGLPVVASDTSTMPELIVEGEGGYLCSLDDPSVFAMRINELARDHETCMRMGEFNRSRAEWNFSIQGMVRGYSELFDELELKLLSARASR